MTKDQELKMLRELAAKYFVPRNIDPEDMLESTVGQCLLCHATETDDVLSHRNHCYWAKVKIVHVKGDLIGQISGEYELFDSYEWIPKKATVAQPAEAVDLKSAK